MAATKLTAESKEALRKAIRDLRSRLIRGVLEAVRTEYRLDLHAELARLPDSLRSRRELLDRLLDERERIAPDAVSCISSNAASREKLLCQVIKEVTFTWVKRLAMLRILEHHGLVRHAIVTRGGDRSNRYQELRSGAGPQAQEDSQDYRVLLEAVFAELAVELPGLFGPTHCAELIPLPTAMLQEIVGVLNEPALDDAWRDDMTLGWVFQYWNDPEREQLDAKITEGGKIEIHEIARKTQMFTERYMVEWLLENSLGYIWLCICKKNGWIADAEAGLAQLTQRRANACRRSQVGVHGQETAAPAQVVPDGPWMYYLLRPITANSVERAPSSIRDLKILEPACGSGHFLISAFDALVAMYREEARHRGESWSDDAIANDILTNNLHGIDIDAGAVQVAAAALWLKAKLLAPRTKLARMNLVAPCFRLNALPEDHPAVARLHATMRGFGVSKHKVDQLIETLVNVQHLGTLFRVDRALSVLHGESTDISNASLSSSGLRTQRLMLGDDAEMVRHRALEIAIGEFLSEMAIESDLGVSFEGPQLTAGLRYVRLLSEGSYDVVIGNPPYLGTQRLADSRYIDMHYSASKEDLYGAFIERSLQLLRPEGLASLVTIRSWMYVSHFRKLREQLLATGAIRIVADLGLGGFDAVPGVESAMVVLSNGQFNIETSIALRANCEKKLDLILQRERFDFDGKLLRQIDGSPVIYQWTRDYLLQYLALPKLGTTSPARVGMKTSDNARFVRAPWEVRIDEVDAIRVSESSFPTSKWIPYIKGAEGKTWIEPLSNLVLWEYGGLQVRLALNQAYGQGPQCERQYFVPGVAFTTIARRFLARAHRYRSIFDVAGSSVFHPNTAGVVCLLNSARARSFVESVNPTINFQVGDVNRLPMVTIANAREIFATLERAFTQHESGRETSVEFRAPGPSSWRAAQDWAQRAVDRPENSPLPAYAPELDAPKAEAEVSFALGVAFGRFGSQGEGVLAHAPAASLPHGILFVGPSGSKLDSLTHPAMQGVVAAWKRHHEALVRGSKQSLREWLRRDFFTHHRTLYENRPIYLPLSSERRNFVAWVSIHRFNEVTLGILVADYLQPALCQLEEEIAEQSCLCTAAKAKHRHGLQRLQDELAEFIALVSACAERGTPPTDSTCPSREVDAPFQMDLNDGVLINSAALWPLLESQWKDPRRWWRELCVARGRKDYDWSHLARRYFPSRVEEKCRRDPSIALGHGCLWRYHPSVAYAWEVRMQSGDGAARAIGEADAEEARRRYLQANAMQSVTIRQQESNRRERRQVKVNAG